MHIVRCDGSLPAKSITDKVFQCLSESPGSLAGGPCSTSSTRRLLPIFGKMLRKFLEQSLSVVTIHVPPQKRRLRPLVVRSEPEGSRGRLREWLPRLPLMTGRDTANIDWPCLRAGDKDLRIAAESGGPFLRAERARSLLPHPNSGLTTPPLQKRSVAPALIFCAVSEHTHGGRLEPLLRGHPPSGTFPFTLKHTPMAPHRGLTLPAAAGGPTGSRALWVQVILASPAAKNRLRAAKIYTTQGIIPGTA